MEMKLNVRSVLGACVLAAALVHHPAGAGMVATEDAAEPLPRLEQGELMSRPELARQLQDLGVPPEEAFARVNALSEEEIRQVAGRVGTLPAGGALSNYELLTILLLVVILALVL